MTEEQILKRLEEVAERKVRHIDYTYTCDLARDYLAFVTGKGLDKMLKQFVRRESEAAFKQRQDITTFVTASVMSNLQAPFRKIFRANYRRILEYQGDGDNDEKVQALEKLMTGFYANMSLDTWCNTRILEANFTDPNAWVVAEWGAFDPRRENAKPYPFEVSSANAYDYGYDERGNLLYLIAASKVPGSTKHERLTLYMQNRTVTLDETEDTRAEGVVGPIGGRYWARTELAPHNLGYVPAIRFGYVRDPLTMGRTYLSPAEPALPYLRKGLKAVSELDLTASLHAFPIPIRAQEDCDGAGCINGQVMNSDMSTTTCPVCQGRGKKKPTSTQEEIIFSMPTSPDQMIDPTKLLAYVSPGIGILEWQTEYADHLTEQAKQAMYTTEIFTRSEVAQTATGKMVDLDSVYDVLYDFGTNLSIMWEFLVKTVARITDKDKGLEARLIVQRDAKLKSFDTLMLDLESVNRSGAAPTVRRAIETDLARIVYADDPMQFRRWEVRERFNPFSGQNSETTLYLLASSLVPQEQKVLYANLGYIFDQIERESTDFYRMEYSKQAAVVAKKLAAIMGAMSGPSLPIQRTGSSGQQAGSTPEATGSAPEPVGSSAGR